MRKVNKKIGVLLPFKDHFTNSKDKEKNAVVDSTSYTNSEGETTGESMAIADSAADSTSSFRASHTVNQGVQDVFVTFLKIMPAKVREEIGFKRFKK